MRDKNSIKQPCNQGFSFLELLLSIAVGVILLAAIYASYLIASRQYTRLVAISEVQEAGIPVLNLLIRDIRMAGHRAVDNAMQSPYGAIDPIVLTDSGDACCDALTITYDKDISTRQRVSYFVQARTNPTRNVLYMSRASWNGTNWIADVTQTPVVDYIEDLQFLGLDPDLNGNPRMVDISMVFRSKTPQLQNYTYQKPDYNVGNYSLTVTDQFYRDDFSATVKVRNLR